MVSFSKWPGYLAIAAFLFVLIITLLSKGELQAGDTHMHYLIARYATSHHDLFLNHWGKPFYTLIYCLPAQLGYGFVKFFTTLIAGVTAYQTYKWASELGLKFPAFSPLFLLLAPMYIWMANSAMTEVLFSFWLVVGLRMLFNNKFFLGALWLSLLPFIRTEGFVLLPFVGAWMLFQKGWYNLFWLSAGTIVYSIIGGFYFGDFAWLVTKNPYPTEVSFYGSGSWFHFISSFKTIWGAVFFAFLVVGLFAFWIKRKEIVLKGWIIILLLAGVYFLFHTIAWATGTMASLGETRVMVAVMPLFALLAALGAEYVVSCLGRKMHTKEWTVFFVLLMANALVVVRPPIKLNGEMQVMSEVSSFLKDNYPNSRIWCTNIQIAKDLNLDIWNEDEYRMYLIEPAYFSQVMKPGEVIVWDAHFSPNEGRTPLKTLLENNGLKEIKRFYPRKNFTVLGGLNYEVVVFVVK